MRYMCCSPPSNRWDDLFKVGLSLLEARELLLLVCYFSKKKQIISHLHLLTLLRYFSVQVDLPQRIVCLPGSLLSYKTRPAGL